MEQSNNYQTTVDTDTFHPRDPDAADVAQVATPGDGRSYGLPEPSGDESVPQLDVRTGATVAMDAMGPVVVNDDGSLSRIANWGKMTDREKEVTQR